MPKENAHIPDPSEHMFHAEAHRHIDESLLLSAEFRGVLKDVAKDPLVAEMISAFLSIQNERVSDAILGGLNDGVALACAAVNNEILRMDKEQAEDILKECFIA